MHVASFVMLLSAGGLLPRTNKMTKLHSWCLNFRRLPKFAALSDEIFLEFWSCNSSFILKLASSVSVKIVQFWSFPIRFAIRLLFQPPIVLFRSLSSCFYLFRYFQRPTVDIGRSSLKKSFEHWTLFGWHERRKSLEFSIKSPLLHFLSRWDHLITKLTSRSEIAVCIQMKLFAGRNYSKIRKKV